MFWVHQQRVLGILHDLSFFLRSGFLHGTTLGTAFPSLGLPFVLFGGLLSCLVPLLLSNSVEDFFTPGNHMERVNAERRLMTVIRNSILDPPGTIAGYQLNAFPLRRRQFLEEALKHLFTEALRRPDHSIRIMVDDDSNVLVALLIGSLVDPDFHQTVKSFVS